MTALYLLLAILALGLAYLVFRKPIKTYFRFRGERLIDCPENHAPAAVMVNAKHAAMGRGQTGLRLKDCSRWPEKQNCGQECLRQIEVAPESCLVRNILVNWYAGKSCVLCGKPLDEMDWMEHKPCFLAADGVSYEWSDVPAEALPETFSSHVPICWNCHVASTFRRKHPELVTDRDWKKTAAN